MSLSHRRIKGAAVEQQVLTDDEAGRGGAQKCAGVTEFGRVTDPAEFGDACAFLCAAASGFIVGQNLLLDGGAFNSTMG